MRQSVTSIVLLAVVIGGLLPETSEATLVIAFVGKNEIVIGADSRRRTTDTWTGTTERTNSSCKIRNYGSMVLTVVGTYPLGLIGELAKDLFKLGTGHVSVDVEERLI